MARVYQAQPIPGVKDLMTLLDFLKNKEAYEQQIHDLTLLHEELTELVEKVGKAEEIEALHGQASQAKLQADQYLADAKAKADALIAEAEEHCHQRMEAIGDMQIEHDLRKEDLAKQEADLHEQRKGMEAALSAREKALAEKEELAHKAKAEADSLIAIYKAKFDKLKGAMEG